MNGRVSGFSVVLTTVGLFAAPGIVSVTAQAPSRTIRSAKTWTPPRTSWGDPDLSGVYTNKYEQRTPMERPPELAGRRIEDITADE